MARKSRIILHGKQAANQELRDAVAAVREDGHEIDVRVTGEAGGAAYFITGLGAFRSSSL